MSAAADKSAFAGDNPMNYRDVTVVKHNALNLVECLCLESSHRCYFFLCCVFFCVFRVSSAS